MLAVKQSRAAVVTGGASGMGKAACHEFGRRGRKVAVLDVCRDAARRRVGTIPFLRAQLRTTRPAGHIRPPNPQIYARAPIFPGPN